MYHTKIKAGQSLSLTYNTQMVTVKLAAVGVGFCMLSFDNDMRTVYNLDSIWINEDWRAYATIALVGDGAVKISISAPKMIKINKAH